MHDMQQPEIRSVAERQKRGAWNDKRASEESLERRRRRDVTSVCLSIDSHKQTPA